MKNLLIGLMTLAVAASIGLSEAQAKRVGGGRDVGRQAPAGTMQRDATPNAPSATPATPAAPQAAPQAAPARPATPAQAPQAAPQRNKWLGPIAGLAAGLGLAALASHLGFGEELASFLMIGLLVMVVLAVIGFIMARRNGAARREPAYAGAAGGGYGNAPIGQEASVPAAGPRDDHTHRYAPLNDAPAPVSAGAASPDLAPAVPAGFDAEGFLRSAKVCFIRMQASYDAGNLQDLREFTSPEMFAELKLEIEERRGAANQTDVTTLDAQLLAVQRVGSDELVSVRFSGMIREQADAPAESFDEVWNFTRPITGEGGWVLAGIQQLSRA
jgi:predicted lipid-binding transport protein (Tim44 family)